MHTHIVIMAGGIGSRFWPLSTPEYPKQFIDILGCGRSLIQLTVDRFKGTCSAQGQTTCGAQGLGICPPENFWVVTNEKYVDIVKEQIPDIPADHILAEPAARNTAPCIAWACWRIKAEDPRANVVVTPSDAVVMNPEEFRRVISNALEFTNDKDAIVTIGIKPTRPETGYGYVQFNDNVNVDIKAVQEFKEKPDFATAQKYLKAGNYLWNAGIFVWNVQTITKAIRTYKPELAAQMDAMVPANEPVGEATKSASPELVERIFPTCEKISIDFAVMEPASKDKKVYTHPADFGWSDLGNWQSLHEKLNKDENNNASVGNVRLYECSNCVVHTEDNRRVVLQGLDGYIVSEKNGQLLVCKRSEEQRIKEFSAN